MSWRKLAVLVRSLPGHSHFVAAQANDPEYAEEVLALPESKRPYHPPVTDWTPEVQALTDVTDQLSVAVAYLTVIAGAKAGQITPASRPVTAIDKARKAARARRHSALEAEVVEAQARWAATHPEP